MMTVAWPTWALTLQALLIQATAWLALGLIAVWLAARRGPRAGALTATAVLAGLLLLNLLAFLPWPTWLALPTLHEAAGRMARSGPAPVEPVTPVAGKGDKVLEGQWVKEPIDLQKPSAKQSNYLPSSDNGLSLVAGPQLPLWLIVGTVAVAGVSLLACLRLLLGLWAVHACRRRSRPVADARLATLCAEVATTLGLHHSIDLRELAGLASPATVGWRRPVILLPDDWHTWSDSELRSVLAHELAHVCRRDYLGWLVARGSAALHAYHPLAHGLLRCLRRDQELAADELAARAAGGPTTYVQALCRLALRRDDQRLGLARTFLPAHLTLTRRVEMVLSRRNRHERILSPTQRWGMAAALLAVCLALAGIRNQRVEAESPAAASTPPAIDIEQKLRQPISFDFKNMTLPDSLAEIEKLTGIPFRIDRDALADADIRPDVGQTLRLEEVSTRSALNILLSRMHLTFIINGDHVLVSTPQRRRGRLVQGVYSVDDLLVDETMFRLPPGQSLQAVLDRAVDSNGQPLPRTEVPAEPSAEERLMKLIVNTIEPRSWADNGGPGTIDYYPLGRALVVNHTPDVQEQVAELLAALRKVAARQIQVETRLLDVSDKSLRRLQRQFGFDKSADAKEVARLDAAQVQQLFIVIYGQRDSEVLQAPRLTMNDGQRGSFSIASNPDVPDLKISLKATYYAIAPGQHMFVPEAGPMPDYIGVEVKLNMNRHEPHGPGSLLNGVGVNSAAGLTGTIVTRELDSSSLVPRGKTAVYLVNASGPSNSPRTVLLLVTPTLIEDEPELIQTGVGSVRPATRLIQYTPRMVINEEEELIQTGVGEQ